MSYDVYLQKPACPTCGHADPGPDLPDPTYNLTPIFDLALTGEEYPNPDVTEARVVLLGAKTERPRGLRVLSGKTGRETVDTLSEACRRLLDPALHDKFRLLEPPNKWGTLESARE